MVIHTLVREYRLYHSSTDRFYATDGMTDVCYDGVKIMANAPENATTISDQAGAERRRHLRIPFTASIEVIESKSGARVTGRTSDVSLGGCYIDTISSFSADSDVLVRIIRNEELFEVRAKVVYVQPGMGMGLVFVSPTPKHVELFQRWLLEILAEV
jgi:hypothetical protein